MEEAEPAQREIFADNYMIIFLSEWSVGLGHIAGKSAYQHKTYRRKIRILEQVALEFFDWGHLVHFSQISHCRH